VSTAVGSPAPVRRRAAAAAAVLLLLGCLAADLVVGRSRGLHVAEWPLVLLVLGWLLAAGAAALLAARADPHRAGLLVLAVAAVLQAAALTAGPQLSDDLYRYVWDGEVAAAGTDPYAYAPDAPELAGLREPFLWPSPAACARLRADLPAGARADPFAGLTPDPGCTRINRPAVRTLYPPTAQLAFRTGVALTPSSLRELRVQIPAALTSLALTGLLVGLLRRSRRPVGWALLYAAGPLAALEAGMDGHVDVLGALLGVAVVGALAGRAGVRRAAAVGVLTAAAALVKLYPAVLGVVAVARYGRSRLTAVCVGAGLLAGALLYLPHVLATGPEVLGYLPGYLRENDYASGQRFLLLGLLGLGARTGVVVAVVLVALVAVALRPFAAEPDVGAVARRATALLGGAMLTVSPGNAWYCSLLVGCAVLAARPEWLGVVAASYVVYGDSLLETGSRWPVTAYAAAAALVAGCALVRVRTEAA
jgi:Glycosyltransferase family 87